MLWRSLATLFYQVFGRYVIGRAPAWTEEVARMLVLWMTMLGRGGLRCATAGTWRSPRSCDSGPAALSRR
jgi:hypothetical protein